MTAMLFLTCGLFVSTLAAESSEKTNDHDVMSRERARRILDHGDGSVLRLIPTNQESRAAKEESLPVFNTPLRMELILPIRIVEVKPKETRKFKVRKASRWRSDAFQKWQKKRKR